MATRLYVGNIPYSMTNDELRAMFAEHGDVVDVHVVMDRETGRARGFAFVSFATDDQANAAVAALHEKRLGGRPMVVNVARERGAGAPPRPGGRPGAPPRPGGPSRSGGPSRPGSPPRPGGPPRGMSGPRPGGAPPMMPEEDGGKETRRRPRLGKKKGRAEGSSNERSSFRRAAEEEEEAVSRGSQGGWRKWIDEDDDVDDIKSPWEEDDGVHADEEHVTSDSDVEAPDDGSDGGGDGDSSGLGGSLAEKLRDSLGKKKD